MKYKVKVSEKLSCEHKDVFIVDQLNKTFIKFLTLSSFPY